MRLPSRQIPGQCQKSRLYDGRPAASNDRVHSERRRAAEKEPRIPKSSFTVLVAALAGSSHDRPENLFSPEKGIYPSNFCFTQIKFGGSCQESLSCGTSFKRRG
jgi:hypothetical protein